jgi:5-formyltetrahydrofolate cyclo-ligase
MQIADACEIPAASHDLGVDLVATPDELVPLPRARKQPEGILWEHVSDEMRGAIPVLERLAPR